MSRSVDASFAEDVREGLGSKPRSIPPKHFYDARGSELFERITELDEYYLTRTERAIFEANADDIAAQAGDRIDLVELGAGSATKTSIIIRAVLARQGTATYYPVDISPAAIDEATEFLHREFPDLEIVPIVGPYAEGLAKIGEKQNRCLAMFIGSSIGNFEPDRQLGFLQRMHDMMAVDDALLLGTDMVKDPAVLVPAYDDAQGVTEAFNKNVLTRINRELGGDFDLEGFRHVAEWKPDASRMEMHLESLRDQTVTIKGLDLVVDLDEGERIHTENSYKFTKGALRALAEGSGYYLERSWYDERAWFGVHLLRKTRFTA